MRESSLDIRDEENNNNIDKDVLINESDNNIQEEEELIQYTINGKANPFKIALMKHIMYFNIHYIKNLLLKISIGFVILVVPFIFLIIFNIINFQEKNKYFFFPYFLSLCLYIGALIVLIVIKLGEGCKIYGIFIYTWERKNFIRILNSIIVSFFILWLLFMNEKFMAGFGLLKEKVAQTSDDESTIKLFYRGCYSLRIIFIFLLWDLEKDKNNKYIRENLGYFEYDDEKLFDEFHSSLNNLVIPIISLSIFCLLKIIFFRTKKGLLFFVLYSILIFQGFFFIFYQTDNSNAKYYHENGEIEYFRNTNCKYVELINFLIIASILLYLSYKNNIKNLFKGKFYPYKNKEKSKIIYFFVILSFSLIMSGYILFTLLIIFLTFIKIDQKFSIAKYHCFWIIFYISIICLLFGYSFSYGHHCYNLIFYSVEYEISPHLLKNEFYKKFSDKNIDSNAHNCKKNYSNRSSNILLHDSSRIKELEEI